MHGKRAAGKGDMHLYLPGLGSGGSWGVPGESAGFWEGVLGGPGGTLGGSGGGVLGDLGEVLGVPRGPPRYPQTPSNFPQNPLEPPRTQPAATPSRE